jgi:hypothetical protein
MSESAALAPGDDVEQVLRADMARADALLGTVTPILRHLVANADHAMFGDEIIARVRGMLGDLAKQLLDALADVRGGGSHDHADDDLATLTAALADVQGLLGHAHALALEWQLTDRLQHRIALDPVVSPLVQALVSSPDPATASLAMNLLAAQARFTQSQRRMKLPLSELPADMLHNALLSLRGAVDKGDGDALNRVETTIRQGYDEAGSRLGLIARLVTGLGGGAVAALSIGHAGVAVFATALALASGQERDLVVLSTSEGQHSRLALALRAAGLKPVGIAEQLVSLHPEAALPGGFEDLGAERAAAILAGAGACQGV